MDKCKNNPLNSGIKDVTMLQSYQGIPWIILRKDHLWGLCQKEEFSVFDNESIADQEGKTELSTVNPMGRLKFSVCPRPHQDQALKKSFIHFFCFYSFYTSEFLYCSSEKYKNSEKKREKGQRIEW